MSPSPEHTLATLASDPDRIEDLDPAAVPELLAAVEGLRARLWRRMTTASPSPNGRPASDTERASGDRLLTVQELADRLSVDDRWVYRKADALPFTRRLGGRTLRFSERGLERWLERQ